MKDKYAQAYWKFSDSVLFSYICRMFVTAREISSIVDGEIIGNPEIEVSAPCRIEEAGIENISFLAHPKYESYVYTTQAGILLVGKNFKPVNEISSTLIKVDDVYGALGKLLNVFVPKNGMEPGISEMSKVDQSAAIGPNVSIGAFSVIKKGAQIGAMCQIHEQVYIGENVSIGKEVTIFPGVKIYAETTIGDRCVIHSNTVLGSDGFGFSKNAQGKYEKIAQIGKVIIENDVEIGSNTVIDRATMGNTIIREGAKLDNLIQIAHNVEVGEHTVIAAQAGIAGSTKIGKNSLIGGQAGFVGHIKVADGTQVQAQSGVMGSITEENQRWFGSPAIGYVQYLKSYAGFKSLPELLKKIKYLEEEIDRLKHSI